jgi:hypothetical protein
MLDYCADQRITFTRGRPYRKNDSCFVEQKELGGRATPGWLPAPGSACPSRS